MENNDLELHNTVESTINMVDDIKNAIDTNSISKLSTKNLAKIFAENASIKNVNIKQGAS